MSGIAGPEIKNMGNEIRSKEQIVLSTVISLSLNIKTKGLVRYLRYNIVKIYKKYLFWQ